ncbi:hypothetical protein GB928_010905 [Shinella curvata]|uniref:Uncharacterized protein n=1 Tax=Shinella curvata TaxID=1817964 RepID=A0ABT8XD70_9HYPH|nr:hypothetical protein [Shinella curvata]MCJ8055273.1 hypothetical protein [Shinella curvata]MDO6121690.1 hypothetical protein [Shinella curvata]
MIYEQAKPVPPGFAVWWSKREVAGRFLAPALPNPGLFPVGREWNGNAVRYKDRTGCICFSDDCRQTGSLAGPRDFPWDGGCDELAFV